MLPQILSLAHELDFPQEMLNELPRTWPLLNIEEIEPHIQDLTDKTKSNKAHEALAAIFTGNDDLGYKSLICQLMAALRTREIFAEQGISDDIFVATLKCLSRFSNEHLASYDVYGFKHGWWSFRFLCGLIYRLGTLEFEIVSNGLSVHIPSDSILSAENLAASYAQAADFFPKLGVMYEQIHCYTWLLHPTLQKILPPTSRILAFQKDYEIQEVLQDTDYMIFAYKKHYPDINSLPEKTSLQRELKKWLLAGGEMGSAHGIYKH